MKTQKSSSGPGKVPQTPGPSPEGHRQRGEGKATQLRSKSLQAQGAPDQGQSKARPHPDLALLGHGTQMQQQLGLLAKATDEENRITCFVVKYRKGHQKLSRSPNVVSQLVTRLRSCTPELLKASLRCRAAHTVPAAEVGHWANSNGNEKGHQRKFGASH